jgi:hypothetical protein
LASKLDVDKMDTLRIHWGFAMEKALTRLIERARETLPLREGYAHEKLTKAIQEAQELLAELSDPDQECRPLYAKLVRILILLGEGGLYD